MNLSQHVLIRMVSGKMALYLPGNETVSESNDGRPFNFSQISAQEEIPRV